MAVVVAVVHYDMDTGRKLFFQLLLAVAFLAFQLFFQLFVVVYA
jgi:hypothetical protein